MKNPIPNKKIWQIQVFSEILFYFTCYILHILWVFLQFAFKKQRTSKQQFVPCKICFQQQKAIVMITGKAHFLNFIYIYIYIYIYIFNLNNISIYLSIYLSLSLYIYIYTQICIYYITYAYIHFILHSFCFYKIWALCLTCITCD